MLNNIDKYGIFTKGLCLDDNENKSLEYINANNDKNYLCYFTIKDENPDFTFNNLNISHDMFPWQSYLKINSDVNLDGNTNQEQAWHHWINHGKEEQRAFSYINNSNIHCGRFGNLFFINMFLNIMAMKYNLKCSYKYADKFKQLGIIFYKGANTYNTNLLVTEKNFIYLLNDEHLEPCNIIITNDVWFQTKFFCQILHRYFKLDKIKSKVINSNKYITRYKNNNDLFIHIRLGDVKHLVYNNYIFLNNLILNTTYDEAYISSDSIEDNFCKKLIKKYKLRIYISNEIETIMFANTCNNIIMTGGTFSWMLGFLGFFTTNIYYLKLPKTWNGDIFCYSNWQIKGSDDEEETKSINNNNLHLFNDH